MDRLDLTKTGGIRRTQDVMNFLQQSYTELFAGLAAMIGDNVIVAGVTDLGATYSDGWVVIAGELLPFVGGLKNTHIVVTENIAQAHYGDGADKDAFYTRFAQCAGAGGVLTSAFTRLPNTYQLATQAQVTTAINNLINSAPGALDTLKELADAMADDPNFATTITALITTKVAKAGDTVTGPLILTSTLDPQGGIKTVDGRFLLKKIIDIGNWNMNGGANGIYSFAHGIGANYKKIKSVKVIVRDDTDALYFDALSGHYNAISGQQLGVYINIINNTNIVFVVPTGSQFLDAAFSTTGGYNRGWIIIEYEP